MHGVLLAISEQALLLEETGFDEVVYFPRTDVALEHLAPTSDRTTCPFKGEARYFSSTAGANQHLPVAWTYPATYEEVLPIEGHVAFYLPYVTLESLPVVRT